MKLVIVTGMSGAGKTIALKMLEDLGFYCVDNPVSYTHLLCLGDSGSSADSCKCGSGECR